MLRLEQSHRYRGFMLSLYWKAACFAQDVVPHRDDAQALRLAMTLVHLARWFQDCGWEDVAWLHWLRGQFDRDA